jgi:polyhydroxyalkanoate synthesis repressor PhaR
VQKNKAEAGSSPAGVVRVIKKYPNRRLYDTDTSSYITLAEVKSLVMDNELFVVRDAKTNDDLTRSILLQIILEEETAGVPILPSRCWPTSFASMAMPCKTSWGRIWRKTSRYSWTCSTR